MTRKPSCCLLLLILLPPPGFADATATPQVIPPTYEESGITGEIRSWEEMESNAGKRQVPPLGEIPLHTINTEEYWEKKREMAEEIRKQRNKLEAE